MIERSVAQKPHRPDSTNHPAARLLPVARQNTPQLEQVPGPALRRLSGADAVVFADNRDFARLYDRYDVPRE